MLKPLRAALTASCEPDQEANSCQWRECTARPVRPTPRMRKADPMMRYTERQRGAGTGRQALLDMT